MIPVQTRRARLAAAGGAAVALPAALLVVTARGSTSGTASAGCGGASDVRTGPDLADRILVAGGGGGSGFGPPGTEFTGD